MKIARGRRGRSAAHRQRSVFPRSAGGRGNVGPPARRRNERNLSRNVRFGKRPRARHWARWQKAYRTTAAIAVPLVVSVHSEVSLLFASRNLERNNALVLKQLLDGHRKPRLN